MNNALFTAGITLMLSLSPSLRAGEPEVPQAPADARQMGSGLQHMSPEERQRFNDELMNRSGSVYPDHEQIESRRQLMREKIQERFERADADNDASLTPTEANLSMPGLARHFDSVDTNHDGLITLDEMKAVYEKKRELSEQKAVRPREAEGLLPVKKRKDEASSATDKPKRGKKTPSRNETTSEGVTLS
jgi:hypothetical protein